MPNMPPALQVSPDCVFVLPWHGLQCWTGSRSRQLFSWGGTHRQQLCLWDSSSVSWAGPCHKIFWCSGSVLCLVLRLKEQVRPEVKRTWSGKSFCLSCWELCCESMKHYKTWRCHKTQLWGFPVWRSKTQGTDTSHYACPASPGASLTLSLAQGPVPAQSVVVSPCPCPAGPKGAASPYCSLKKTIQKIWHCCFHFFLSIYVLHIQLRE